MCNQSKRQNCIRGISKFPLNLYAMSAPLYTSRMSAELNDKLNALVGEALKGLVESGAGAESIGAFAATYRLKASQILGIAEAPPAEPDLQALVSEAVTSALASAGIGQPKPREKRPTAHRFIVHIQGKRTSVTISAAASERLLAAHSNRSDVTSLLESLANQAPATETNRSRWVEQRALASLSAEQLPAQSRASIKKPRTVPGP